MYVYILIPNKKVSKKIILFYISLMNGILNTIINASDSDVIYIKSTEPVSNDNFIGQNLRIDETLTISGNGKYAVYSIIGTDVAGYSLYNLTNTYYSSANYNTYFDIQTIN